MTVDKIICGTVEEIREYYSFVGKTPKTEWCKDMDFDKQVEPLLNSDKHIGLIFYLDRRHGLSFVKTFIYIRKTYEY